MKAPHKLVLYLSFAIILAELAVLIYYHEIVIDWVSKNLWVVAVPFTKVIFKRLMALKLIAFFKAIGVLFWHLSKLVLLKILKIFSIRYGLFFSQRRWYPIRKAKVVFLRRGKQFFRKTGRFWAVYQRWHKIVIITAFFPVCLLLFLLGMSFNITRKTMVKKAQESAMVKAATTATQSNKGIRAMIARADKKMLDKIKQASISAAQKNTDEVA